MLEYFTAALREGDATQHGEYELRYAHEYTGGRGGRHVIEAHHPEDGRVGRMEWMGRPPYAIHNITVEPEHQRRGLATAMWNWAQENARPKPRHSEQRTDAGDAWARSVGGRLPRRTSRLSPVQAEGLFPSNPGHTVSAGISEYFGGGHGAAAHPGRTAGRGKPRRDRNRQAPPGGGEGGPAAGQQRGQAGEGGARLEGPRPVEFHPAAHKDLKALDKPVQKQIKGVIEALARGDQGLQTHALTQKLSGWYSTKASRGHRVVHRPTDDGGIHVGYIGLHDYDKAIRRLTSRESKDFGGTVRMVPPEEYRKFRYPDYPGAATPAALVRHFKKTSPEYYDKIKSRVQEEGFTTPVLVRWSDPRGKPLRKPEVMEGHHRAAVAHELGLHLPVGDYDNPDDYDIAFKAGQQWFRENQRPAEGVSWKGSVRKRAVKVAKRDVMEVAPYLGDVWRDNAAEDFRRVVFTSPLSQFTLMTLQPGEDIGAETHADVDQILMLLEGSGRCLLETDEMPFTGNAVLCVPRGVRHNIMNGEDGPMRLATVYAPAHHAAGTVHHTKADAAKDTKDEYRKRALGRREAMNASPGKGPLPINPGKTWYRLHYRPRAWSDATSAEMNVYDPTRRMEHTRQEGFSAFGDPHTLDAYLEEMGWYDHLREHDPEHRNHVIVQFPGEHTGGHGANGEPLVKPGPRADRVEIPIKEFWDRLEETPRDDEPGSYRHQRDAPRRQMIEHLQTHHPAAARLDAAHYTADFSPWSYHDVLHGPKGEGMEHDHAGLALEDPQRHRGKTAAHPRPTSRIFGPTYGLDHRLFIGDQLKPEVRTAVMSRLGPVIEPLLGQDWQRYTKVYLAGSEASEWTSETLEGNGDFDTLIGVDYDHLKGEPGVPVAHLDDQDITDALNKALREGYNASPWKAPFGGEWDLTGYCNAGSYDIRRIKPYAAYNITDDTWAVRPPHLPDWSIEKLPEGGDNLLAEAEGYAKVIEAIAKMPEPFRTQQGKALWHHLHSDRGRAFSDEGEGWLDPGNLIEKALVEWGLWDKLVEWQYGKQKTAAKMDGPWYHGTAAELQPGDLIEPGKHPKSFPSSDEEWRNVPRDHVYFTNRRRYVTEYYGPNLYEVEPTGPHTHDPEYRDRQMRRSQHPLRVVRKVSEGWGRPIESEGKTAARQEPWVEHVRVDKLLPHREWQHQPGGFSYTMDGDGPYAPKHDAESWEANKRSVAEEGVREPLTLKYNPTTHSAYLGEGNHRLHWARELGHQTVPVRMWRTSEEMPERYRLQGRPKLTKDEHGYFPQDGFKPSDVLPADYFPSQEKTAVIGPDGKRRDTDWDQAYGHLDGPIYRGMKVVLPEEVHRRVHDESRPTHERARELLEHLNSQGRGHPHWTTDQDVAAGFFAGQTDPTSDFSFSPGFDPNDPGTRIMLEAEVPGREHIETDPGRLSDRGVLTHSGPEREVPLKRGAPLRIRRVVWSPANSLGYATRHRFDEPQTHFALKTAGMKDDRPELTFRHLPPEENRPYGGAEQDTHTLHAYLPDGSHVGELSWFGEDGMIRDVGVHPDHRRKGIASELLRRARQIQPDVYHSDALTSDGAGWARKVSMLEYFTAADDDEHDYRMQHRPPDTDFGSPHHDISEDVMPGLYDNPEWHDHSGEPSYWDAFRHVLRTRGKPEAKVTIYRSLPAEHAHQGFRPGDWVSTSKEYARRHGQQSDPEHDWPVIRTTVPAKHLQTEGNDLREWGYTGPHKDMPMISYKGGYHQEVRHDKDGRIKPVKRRKPKTAMPAKHHPPTEGFSYHIEDLEPDDNDHAKQEEDWPGWHHRILYGKINGRLAGHIVFSENPGTEALSVGKMETYPNHRGKGLASAMQDALAEEHPRHWINHGSRTGAGQSWWESYDDPAPDRNIHNFPREQWERDFEVPGGHGEEFDRKFGTDERPENQEDAQESRPEPSRPRPRRRVRSVWGSSVAYLSPQDHADSLMNLTREHANKVLQGMGPVKWAEHHSHAERDAISGLDEARTTSRPGTKPVGVLVRKQGDQITGVQLKHHGGDLPEGHMFAGIDIPGFGAIHDLSDDPRPVRKQASMSDYFGMAA